MEKVSQYNDQSWEFSTKSGITFRLKSDNYEENRRWFQLLNQLILDKDDDQSLNSDDGINLMRILPDFTDLNLHKHFCFTDVYLLDIEEDKITLKNKNKPIETHSFNAK